MIQIVLRTLLVCKSLAICFQIFIFNTYKHNRSVVGCFPGCRRLWIPSPELQNRALVVRSLVTPKYLRYLSRYYKVTLGEVFKHL